jgi:hypothetical protein
LGGKIGHGGRRRSITASTSKKEERREQKKWGRAETKVKMASLGGQSQKVTLGPGVLWRTTAGAILILILSQQA